MYHALNIVFLVDSVKPSIPVQITSVMQIRLIFELLCLDIDPPCCLFLAIAFALRMNLHLVQIDWCLASASKAMEN